LKSIVLVIIVLLSFNLSAQPDSIIIKTDIFDPPTLLRYVKSESYSHNKSRNSIFRLSYTGDSITSKDIYTVGGDGLWRLYYKNSNIIKEIGSFSRLRWYVLCIKANKLKKSKTWLYYNEKGVLYREEAYFKRKSTEVKEY
jgi:hypothetical protein